MQPAVGLTEPKPSHSAPAQERVWLGMPYPLLLDVSSLKLTDIQLEKISADNGDLQLELTAKGELVIMPPTGDPGSLKETELTRQVSNWAIQDGTGVTYGPTGGFRLPNRALRGPDVSWVTRERREAWLKDQEERPEENRGSFLELCPDFVLELPSSRRDSLPNLQRKMEEYLENGARLGWLIDPINKQVHIYHPGEPAEILNEPETVSGEPVLPGFELDLTEIW